MGWTKPPNVAGSAAPAIMIGLFVAFGGILFGYDTGTISGIIAMKWWRKQFSTGFVNGLGELDVTPRQASLVVSMLSAGTFVGALCAAPFADHIGRRPSLILAVAVFTLGCTLQTVALRIPIFTTGRFIAGIGVGYISVLVPLYQSEMAPKWIRGALVCAYQLAITAGLFIAAIINNFTQHIDGPSCFRIPVAVQFVWAGILFLGLMLLPETPRYLIKRDRHGAAASSLSRIRRLDITHPALIEELAEIEANHAYELYLGPSTYRDVFFGQPRLGRRVLTGCGLQILQQLSGCNFIFYYGTTFFKDSGFKISPFVIQLITNVVNVASTLPGIILVDSIGRRKLLMTGAIGMAISQYIVASVGSAFDTGDPIPAKIIITFISVYIFFFASSWGPVAWVVTSEIYPLKVRAKSMSISTSANWFLNFILAYSTPYIVQDGRGNADLGPKVFFIWGTCCLVGSLFVWTMVYETSKLSLEQIDELYERVDYAWKSANFQPSWSFQEIREETEHGVGSGVNLADREEARRRTNAQPPPLVPPGLRDNDSADSDRITVSQSGSQSSSSTTYTSSMSNEDKIIASLGHVDFSL